MRHSISGYCGALFVVSLGSDCCITLKLAPLMEKHFKSYNALMWGISAIVVGVILIVRPAQLLPYIVRIVGIVSILLGVIQFLAFLVRTKGVADRWKYLPVAAPIAVIWGALLLLSPELWSSVFMILFGVLLIFLGIYQLVTMYKIKKEGVKVAAIYFVFPILLIIAGFMAFVQPIYMATWFMAFVGAWILAYGVMEVFAYFSLRGPIEAAEQNKEIQEAEEADKM